MINEELHCVADRQCITAAEMRREMENISQTLRNQVVVRALEISRNGFPVRSRVIRNEFAFQTGHEPSDTPSNAGVGCIGVEMRNDDATDAHVESLINDFTAIDNAVHNMTYKVKAYAVNNSQRLLNTGWIWDDRTSLAFIPTFENNVDIPIRVRTILAERVFANIGHVNNSFEDFKTRLITSIVNAVRNRQ